ncbi:hypothetical protein ACO0M4_07820 [Streptomyces sp. RGM 3693]|uniref:hypothetical protein n=1 Tax=Streptomyces sp. RGM 3693 TaxID=3413284 RepID=UPI003D2A1180
MDSIMRAAVHVASEMVGAPVGEPEVVGRGLRSVVMRCSLTGGTGSVIVKAFSDEPEGRRSFTSEAVGLSLGLAGPALLGADAAASVVVMEDVGPVPSLADALVGADAPTAALGLRGWARELGRIAAASVERREKFTRLWKQYDKGMEPWGDEWIEQNGQQLLAALEAAGVTPPAGLAAELHQLATAREREYTGFTPGDPCPYNALIAPGGVRLIDFEFSGYLPVFLTAAYCRSPFPNCWCVYQIPDQVAAQTERVFRAEVVRSYPGLAEDEVWEAGMRWATAVWMVDATAYWLRQVTLKDGPLRPDQSAGPTRRQVLRYRWERAEELLTEGDFPAVRAVASTLLHEVGNKWEMPPFPVYPAFARRHESPSPTGVGTGADSYPLSPA